MRLGNRIHGLLALLLAGGASLMAQVTDPFPAVPFRQYYGNMQLTAKAKMNGEVLTGDVVIAVYTGEQIRGKGSPEDESNQGVVYIQVYGNYDIEHLHFKVAVKGTVIEVDPGDLSYSYNGVVGSPANPYIFDVPAPIVTTPSAEGWATTCLPFNAEVPEGVTVWNATGIEDTELLVTKAEGTILPANMPVLLQSEGLASYEWLSRVADGDIVTTGCIFLGTTEPTEVAAGSVLTLGHSNESGEIGFWRFTGTTIPANRAYIADFPAGVRGLTLLFDDETTDINLTSSSSPASEGKWYDLEGRRLSSKPAARGIYIADGKKFFIR